MDTFGILGFMFGMLGFMLAVGANAKVNKLEKELKDRIESGATD